VGAGRAEQNAQPAPFCCWRRVPDARSPQPTSTYSVQNYAMISTTERTCGCDDRYAVSRLGQSEAAIERMMSCR
jgi:hypothetical protein